MKPILAVLALVLTSTLFAQEPGRKPVREPRPQGTEQEAPRPRDERMHPPRQRMRGERTRSDAEQEGGPHRPGHGRPPHGGRGNGRGEHGPRPRPHGGDERGNGEGPRRPGKPGGLPESRGTRSDAGGERVARIRERAQDLRQAMGDWMRMRAAMQRRMEQGARTRTGERLKLRADRAV